MYTTKDLETETASTEQIAKKTQNKFDKEIFENSLKTELFELIESLS